MNIRTGLIITALAVVLAGCETATPYQPLGSGTAVSGGFSDQRLDDNHVRVSFKGNTATSRVTVENYMLYRAAELTVQNGYDWFEEVDQHTDRDKHTYVESGPYGPGYGFGYFRPYWSIYGRRGWGPWGPWGGPYWGEAEVETVQKFQATADIALHHGPKPMNDPRALDAHQVLANLGPKIMTPAAKP